MSYPMALGAVFTFFALTVLGIIAWQQLSAYRLRHFLLHYPFPDTWRALLASTPHYHELSPDVRERLEREIVHFVHTKRYSGIDLALTDEMRVLIAFYALLMVVKNPALGYGFLRNILIYSRDFVVHERHEHGCIVNETDSILDGQASDDTIVFAWDEAKAEVYEGERYNVIIHECAHLLDFEYGVSEGMYEVVGADISTSWHTSMRREYDDVAQASRLEEEPLCYGLLGDYATTNEAEFFAVASERFFMVPHKMKKSCPSLFALMKSFYAPEGAAKK